MTSISQILEKLNCTENGHILFDFTAIIEQLNKEGIFFNNLFQLESGLWQANFQSATSEYEFGIGTTIGHAISAAIVKLQSPTSRKTYEIKHGLVPSQTIEEFFNASESSKE